mgnify:CR=1 FL=1
MSTEYNNTSDWTLEDCQSYINILYANRTSSFKERKAKAFFNSQTKKNRKTTITNDGIYVDGKPFLSPANIKKCVSVGSLYFFERKDSMLIRCVKADGEKLQSMKDFLSVNNIDFTSDSPDEAYRLRYDAKLYKKSNKPLLIVATIIFLISMFGLNINKNVPFYAADIQYRAASLAGIYQTISSGTFYIVMIVLLALSLVSLIIFSLPLSVSRIYLPVLFVIYAGLEYVAFNVILSKAAMLLSNRLLGRTASLNLTYANTDFVSYVSLGVVLAIIMNIAYRKMKSRA